jgi:hypothetical protein
MIAPAALKLRALRLGISKIEVRMPRDPKY